MSFKNRGYLCKVCNSVYIGNYEDIKSHFKISHNEKTSLFGSKKWELIQDTLNKENFVLLKRETKLLKTELGMIAKIYKTRLFK